jgi:hypothetical protein
MRLLLAALLLSGCSSQAPEAPERNAAVALEQEAIARGLVRDPSDGALTGLYARGTDRLCIVPGERAYDVGLYIDYGGGIRCSATGSIAPRGDGVRVALGEDGDCTIDAEYDGGRIAFPGQVPDGCKRHCRSRASLAGFAVERMSNSRAEASAMRGPRGELLCKNAHE